MRRTVVGLLAGLLCASAWAEAPSVDLLSRHLIAESLAPVLELVESEYPGLAISVRADLSELTANGIGPAYAELLLDRGYEVYEIRGQQRAAEASLLLEIRPRAVSIDYGRVEKAFLGLGAGKQERNATLDVGIRLSHADSGRLLYEEQRSLERLDWIPAGSDAPIQSGDPFFTPAKTGNQQSQQFTPQVSWLERGLAVGLLSGIIVVYFSASS